MDDDWGYPLFLLDPLETISSQNWAPNKMGSSSNTAHACAILWRNLRIPPSEVPPQQEYRSALTRLGVMGGKPLGFVSLGGTLACS